MTRLPRLRDLVTRQERANADLLYPHRPTWTDGSSARVDVEEADPRSRAYARAVQTAPDLAQQDVRFLTYHPDDTPPAEGSECAWDGGTLTLRHWGQVDEYDGTALGICVWRL